MPNLPQFVPHHCCPERYPELTKLVFTRLHEGLDNIPETVSIDVNQWLEGIFGFFLHHINDITDKAPMELRDEIIMLTWKHLERMLVLLKEQNSKQLMK